MARCSQDCSRYSGSRKYSNDPLFSICLKFVLYTECGTVYNIIQTAMKWFPMKNYAEGTGQIFHISLVCCNSDISTNFWFSCYCYRTCSRVRLADIFIFEWRWRGVSTLFLSLYQGSSRRIKGLVHCIKCYRGSMHITRSRVYHLFAQIVLGRQSNKWFLHSRW